jgi:hypothetical protein
LIFVACYDANGDVQWVKQAGGDLEDRARAIGTDGSNIYITGQFGYTAQFGNMSVSAADSSDIFIAALSNSGDWMWVKAVGGVADTYEDLGYECGNAICANPAGDVFTTGSYLNTANFDGIEIDTYDRTDIFVTKIRQVGLSVDQSETVIKGRLFPNPASTTLTVDLDSQYPGKVETSIYNCLGDAVERRVGSAGTQLNFDLSRFERGIYFVEVKAGEKIYREKVVLQ